MKALLLMGGEGYRFGAKTPKQFLNLSGKQIYLHTLSQFSQFNEFEEILLVCHPDWISSLKKTVSDPRIRVIEGGKTRQDSSYRGLLSCGRETDFVLIHDAVRPLVSEAIICRHIEALKKYRAVNTCIPSDDTIVHAQSFDTVSSIPNRSQYLRGQTPQSFSYPLILEAHEKAPNQEASDDCSLVLKLGHPVHIVPGSFENIKITHQIDLFLAEQLIRLKRHSTRESSISLKGKTYAITGGMGGIGSALAQSLKEEGAYVLTLSRSSPDYPIELTHFREVSDAFDKIMKTHGPLDGLINCVGFLSLKPFKHLTSDEIDHLIKANLHSFLYSCHCAKIKKGGHMINLSSSAFSRGRKNYVLYSAAKAAIVNFTQGLAEEHPELQVNVVVPQRTNTQMRQTNFPGEDPKTLLSPKEVSMEILKILKSKQITGTILDIKKQE